jgi:Polyketide cyclase / dehydrase and lipid transport
MDIHFNDTRPAGAPAATLFDVITDYPRYPDFNPALIHVTVISKTTPAPSSSRTATGCAPMRRPPTGSTARSGRSWSSTRNCPAASTSSSSASRSASKTAEPAGSARGTRRRP